MTIGYPAYLNEPDVGGHGFGMDNGERAAFFAAATISAKRSFLAESP
ncbi:hypothetical protein SAMCFNEI73_pB0129 (plasmid) [Sinorhizobium americanum]|uniref:Uncharacterized protein n=1 Tax=Sinorhizobium americanum TaxID=194963 RepID=A0A1L3LTA5_9HYPH|nr:hypothetical protein SAMCFNEI73_pB0129 [Sinorhizobium americanum]